MAYIKAETEPRWQPSVLQLIDQGAQAEKTIDQTRKNIQVLEGQSESQLFLLMNFVASSAILLRNTTPYERKS